MEIWKDVIGYEGLYQVSDLGRVKRVAGYRCRVERVLKTQNAGAGYLQVGLCRDGKRSMRHVHRLVLEAHAGLAPEGCEGNHKNGITGDNCVANLEWVTCSENHKHAYRVLGREPTGGISKGEANGNARLTRQQVIEIRELAVAGEHTQRELGELFGVSNQAISAIVRRETWQHVA